MESQVVAVPMEQREVESRIRELVVQTGLTAASDKLSRDDDLFDAGLTSHASVRLMLALEDAFDVEFPDEMLQREYFSSIATIAGAIELLLEPGEA